MRPVVVQLVIFVLVLPVRSRFPICTQDEDRAKDAVSTITGGRFSLLNRMVEEWATHSNDEIRNLTDSRVRGHLADCGVPVTHPVMLELSREGEIHRERAFKLLDKQKLAMLMDKDVISSRPGGRFVLGSRHIQSMMSKVAAGNYWPCCGHSIFCEFQ